MAMTPFGSGILPDAMALQARMEDMEAEKQRRAERIERQSVRIENIDRIMLPIPHSVLHRLGNGWLLTVIPNTGGLTKHLFFPTLCDLGNHYIVAEAEAALNK